MRKEKDYTHFTAIDFLQDEDFVSWIECDEQVQNAWTEWFARHPEKAPVADEAKRIVRAIEGEKQFFLHDSKQQEMWANVERHVDAGVSRPRFSKTIKYIVAASAPIFIAAAIVFSYKQFEKEEFISKKYKHEQSELLRYSNESEKPNSLVLSDGSIVILQPHSSLEYPRSFSSSSRNVYLNGEAFFEVTKDAMKPFSVFADKIVTRVLGTSFSVRAYDRDKEIVVVVKTGKVSVLTSAQLEDENRQDDDPVGTLLTPNQQVVFSKKESQMVRSLVKDPTLLPSSSEVENFQFIDTPINVVFERLEKVYGVEIIFDEELMSACLLNASLRDDSFYDQLRLICKGVGAKYQLLDGHVIITGGGCQQP